MAQAPAVNPTPEQWDAARDFLAGLFTEQGMDATEAADLASHSLQTAGYPRPPQPETSSIASQVLE